MASSPEEQISTNDDNDEELLPSGQPLRLQLRSSFLQSDSYPTSAHNTSSSRPNEAINPFDSIREGPELSPLVRWLNESPQDGFWWDGRHLYNSSGRAELREQSRQYSGGIETRGHRPATPVLPPRLAGQQGRGTTGGGGDGGPRCDRCNAKLVRVPATALLSFRYECPVCVHCVGQSSMT